MQRAQLVEMYELEDSYWWFVARRRMVRGLVERYAPKREQLRILDAGCGTGGTMLALEGLGEAWGCDMSGEAIALARRRGVERLRKCRVEELAFDDESFDVVVSCDVLEHVEEDAVAMSEMARVLRPGGICVLTVPAHRFLWSEHDEALEHVRRYETREFADLVKGTGLSMEKFTHAVALSLPAIVAYRALKRLLTGSGQESKTALVRLPRPVNSILIGLLHLESWLMKWLPLPLGASLVAVARRTGAAEER